MCVCFCMCRGDKAKSQTPSLTSKQLEIKEDTRSCACAQTTNHSFAPIHGKTWKQNGAIYKIAKSDFLANILNDMATQSLKDYFNVLKTRLIDHGSNIARRLRIYRQSSPAAAAATQTASVHDTNTGNDQLNIQPIYQEEYT